MACSRVCMPTCLKQNQDLLFSKLIMLFLVLTCSFVSRTDSYSVAGKVSFDTNGNDPAVKGLVCYHICI